MDKQNHPAREARRENVDSIRFANPPEAARQVSLYDPAAPRKKNYK